MIVLHAAFPIDPDSRNEVESLLEELVERSRAEDGILEYRATWDALEPNRLRFFEQYADESAFEHHTQTDHFQKLEDMLPDVLAGEPEVLRFDVDSATELDL